MKAGIGDRKMSSQQRARDKSARAGNLPEQIFLWEILIRLPPKDLNRCRAVSRAWRRAVSARDFLLAHHRRQPSLPLINRRSIIGEPRWSNIAALDHRAAQATQQIQPVARLDGSNVSVKASCDGLLILAEGGLRPTPLEARCSVCNPATRQIRHLSSQLKGHAVLGLYRHQPTSEYRLLLRRLCSPISMQVFELDHHHMPPRRVECTREVLCYPLTSSAPLLLRGNLHWTWHTLPLPFGQTETNKTKTILVFDTTAESFRQMPSPPDVHAADLFDMDGVLGMYSWDNGDRSTVRIWVMQDYESQVWSPKCSVECWKESLVPEIPLTQEQRNLVMAMYEEGDVRLLLASEGSLLCVDSQGKLLRSSRDDGHSLSISKHFLKQSLVSYGFFPELRVGINAWPFI
uniref:Uncharacterized protein n=1 Tax=Avena sativa TaxID=4498 RepID=A0ACD5XAZ8_AVESA